jgi:hypothetical protein
LEKKTKQTCPELCDLLECGPKKPHSEFVMPKIHTKVH